MKPLRNTREFSSESERRIAELLATLEPYKPNPARKHSLGLKLAARRPHAALRILRPVAGLALLFAGTAAAATLGERLWSEPIVEQAPPEIPVARSLAPPAKPKAATRATPDAPAKTSETAESIAVPGPLRKAQRPSIAPPRAANSAPKKAVRSSEDPRPVAEALRALRKERDPARAQSLLSEYMRASPQGALSEEALALSIEAAHARKDPAAKGHARRYLARYPAGRHRRLAERVLAE